MQGLISTHVLCANFVHGDLYSSKYLVRSTLATNGFNQIAFAVVIDHRSGQDVVLLESLPDHLFGIVATATLRKSQNQLVDLNHKFQHEVYG